MSDDHNIDLDVKLKKAKILEQKQKFAQEKNDISWQAVAKPKISPEELLKIKHTWENKTISFCNEIGLLVSISLKFGLLYKINLKKEKNWIILVSSLFNTNENFLEIFFPPRNAIFSLK